MLECGGKRTWHKKREKTASACAASEMRFYTRLCEIMDGGQKMQAPSRTQSKTGGRFCQDCGAFRGLSTCQASCKVMGINCCEVLNLASAS